jgi:hypothetical protein
MDSKEVFEKLGIEDYADRIFKSNSHGELFHLQQYYDFVELKANKEKFRKEFIKAVEYAEKNWERPESVFQHIRDAMFFMWSLEQEK